MPVTKNFAVRYHWKNDPKFSHSGIIAVGSFDEEIANEQEVYQDSLTFHYIDNEEELAELSNSDNTFDFVVTKYEEIEA